MHLNETAGEFIDSLELSGFRLGRPEKFIFLCGGIRETDLTKPAPSAREAFLRSLQDRKEFNGYKIVLAEDIDVFYPDSPYSNLIYLEKDIAELSDSVVLFSEGIGSLAELGAFTQIPAIAKRMIVILQEEHYSKKSFVRDGPIRSLEQSDSESVLVYDWKVNRSTPPQLDPPSFDLIVEELKQTLHTKLKKLPGRQSIDVDQFSNKTFTLCALVDAFGALKFEELSEALLRLGINIIDSELRRILFSTIAVGWLRLKQVGNTKFYLPNFQDEVCEYRYKTLAKKKDTVRWKFDLKEHWKTREPNRYKLIRGNVRGGKTQ